MTALKYFPLGIAKGDAFCNRVEERKILIRNINACRHMMVMSPRRYGKSSLILYATQETGMCYTEVDLFVSVNAKTVEEQIFKGIKDLFKKISSPSEQIVAIIKDYIKKITIKMDSGNRWLEY